MEDIGLISNVLNVKGLRSNVFINVDQWGVPHIQAQNRHDLFFAQGWNAARDRLWQIDLARKRGLGLLSRDFGPGYLAQDKASRLFLYRGEMAAEWSTYGPDAEEICTAFTNGINAYLDACDEGVLKLPPEFAVLGNYPDRWKPEDVVRIRTHSLTRNASSELLRSKIFATAGRERGAKLDTLRRQLSYGATPRLAAGFDPGVMSDRVLQDFLLAISPVTFSRERLSCPLDEADRWVVVTPSGEVARSALEQGSNNWAVSAERTATGRPILALDPHRYHTLPSIRYVVHLTAPGLDIVGAGEPMVPGLSMGHNGTAAFALTIFGADQEDVYVYDTASHDADSYAYGDDWDKFQFVDELIPVKGYPTQQVRLAFTRHGPVVHRDEVAKRAFAIRTVLTNAGAAPYMASLSVMRAKSHQEFTQSLDNWACPSVNYVYADVGNTIAWQPAGLTPIRENWDGLTPVPGDGRFEWAGYMRASDLPSEVNPARGFIATANAMNIPDDWSKSHPVIAYEWLDSSRHDSLHHELGRDSPVSLEDCARLQCSTVSPIARRVLKTLTSLVARMNDAPVWPFLTNWDGDLSAESGPAALFEVWLSKHLGPLVARREGANTETIPLLMPFDAPAIAGWLENARASDDLVADLKASLSNAWSECSTLMGADPATWAWGRLHQLKLSHPLQALIDDNWSLEAMALGGSSSTLNYAAYRLSDYSVVGGPSVRMVIDVGNWDGSLFINSPGQSGVPGTAYYSNLAPSWRHGEYKPLLYSVALIEDATAIRMTLMPA